MGVRGSPTGEIVLDDCVVPGREPASANEGRASRTRWARSTGPGRSSARRRSASRRARSTSRRSYVQERKQFGRAIADFQGLQFMLADMATAVDAARLLVYRACSLLDDGLGGTPRPRARRRWRSCSRPTPRCASRPTACSCSAASATRKDVPAERFMRDAKITQIYEGTNQIQRVVIAKRLLGG